VCWLNDSISVPSGLSVECDSVKSLYQDDHLLVVHSLDMH